MSATITETVTLTPSAHDALRAAVDAARAYVPATLAAALQSSRTFTDAEARAFHGSLLAAVRAAWRSGAVAEGSALRMAADSLLQPSE